MTKEFEPTNFGVTHQYKVVANFRDNKVSIYERYGNKPYSKAYVSTSWISRNDINKIMFEFTNLELRSFILKENFTAGRIRVFTNFKK